MLRTLRELTKSGIVLLVGISTVAGYAVGQPPGQPVEWSRFVATLVGIYLLASGSSALNQLQEVALDGRMPRTAKRPLPSGRLSRRHAGRLVAGLLAAGTLLLGWVDPQVAGLGALAVLLYNGAYTLHWKPRWAHAAVPGAIPGALPVWMGFVAARGAALEPEAIFLFLLVFAWQMPHFWILALRFREDYRLGGVPTLPVAAGNALTLREIRLWSLAYVGLLLSAPLFLEVGALYGAVALLLTGILWIELRVLRTAPSLERRTDASTAAPPWLRFFLWINASLVAALAAAATRL